ncbi:DUF932 domain-containing protein [Botrimarina hoheduenensis]|uniref:DUF932 domain-containing protein n=1 Tax=Botrimarina hoheduenensis TaxID=2528000 RepID=A0A5C5VZE1_9BACT|nr:DUF932 domain-containing protein [Botrimarina hoheduenensis]TWT43467.1 hypothetical protein Pla111_24180 [Botrimarina hoheduenensis]
MSSNVKLGEVITQAERIESEAVVFDTKTAEWNSDRFEIRPIVNGTLADNRISFPFTQPIRDELYRRLGYPGEQVQRRLACETRARVIRELVDYDFRQPKRDRRLPDTFCLMLVDGHPAGLIAGNLHTASNAQFFRAVRSAAAEVGFDLDEAEVRRHEVDDGSTRIEATFGELISEPRPGDLVHFGLAMQHSSAGRLASRVEFFAHRLVCANGMTAPVCMDDAGRQKRMRIRRGGEAEIGKTLQRIQASASQAFRTIDQRMAALKELTNERVDLKKLVDRVVANNRWSRVVREELLAAISRGEHGGDETQFGVVNLLSYLGTHGAYDPDRRIPTNVRRRLQLMAGVYAGQGVHTCPTCQRILSPSNN